MREILSEPDPTPAEPLSNMQNALQILDDWENGRINDFGPDGLAVVLHLQRARVAQQISTIAIAEL